MCRLFVSGECHKHLMVTMPCGSGKSIVFILQVANWVRGSAVMTSQPHVLVVTPWSSLSYQHYELAKAKLESLPITIGHGYECSQRTHVRFMSITDLARLRRNGSDIGSEYSSIIIDECHSLFCEGSFRFNDYRDALSNLASAGRKILMLSATMTSALAKSYRRFLNISNGEYIEIYDRLSYRVPTVSLTVVDSSVNDVSKATLRLLKEDRDSYTHIVCRCYSICQEMALDPIVGSILHSKSTQA